MDNYDKHFQEVNRSKTGEYSRDGAINPSKWASSNPRIIFMLKQTAGYSESSAKGWSIVDEIERDGGWLSPGKKAITYKKLASLSWLLSESMKRGAPLSEQESKKLGKSRNDLIAAISNSAIVNICKHSGSVTSNNKYILDQGKKNSTIIRQQIEELSPGVIVAGSDVVWNALANSEWGICKDIISEPVQRHECKRFNNIIFYHANHPSAWTGGGFDVIKIHRQIYELLMS